MGGVRSGPCPLLTRAGHAGQVRPVPVQGLGRCSLCWRRWAPAASRLCVCLQLGRRPTPPLLSKDREEGVLPWL